jgi:hypothetical protein
VTTQTRGDHVGFHRHSLLVSGVLALILALAPAADVAAWFQTATTTSPASEDSQVIAHGVLPIPAGDLIWRIEREIAPPPATVQPTVAATGFLLGSEGAVLVEDTATGEQARLAPGEGLLTRAGAEQVRAAIGANAATYDALTLVAADAAAGTDELVFASEPFPGLDGRHDVDLVRNAMAASESVELPGGAGPTLLFVTAGALDAQLTTGEIVTLTADQAIALAGPLVLTAGAEGAVVQAAVIGPAVPQLTGPEAAAPTGTPAPAAPVASPIATVPPTGSPVATAPAATPAAVPTEAAPVETPATDAVDSDSDGLPDADEAGINTDPASADTDGDGLTDGDEVLVHGTAPLAPDSDGDGVLDGDEINQGTDPLTAGTAPGAVGDSDGDGLEDSIEAELGTDPADTDTDDDGLTDGDEYYTYQTGTRNPDNDADGVLDGTEIENGTDPNDPNSF